MKNNLTKEQLDTIIELLKEGKPLPEEYRWLLFEGKQETELIYAGKTRDIDVLTETMAVPLQKVKVFGDVKDDEWHNMLIFGDNLQVLKTLLKMKQEGKLRNADGTKGVRLIYIDPPFATKQEFRSKNGEKAYQDKIVGAQFLEWLRERLILLRELLSDDGSIYVHLDWKMGHYIKILMDEIFDKGNFRNDIIWSYGEGGISTVSFPHKHDIILFYSKSTEVYFTMDDQVFKKPFHESTINMHFKHIDDQGRRYRIKKIGNKVYKYYADEGRYITDVWDDISAQKARSPIMNEYTGFPTQKPERLLNELLKPPQKRKILSLMPLLVAGLLER
jgi:site-specific DNA-methyltransferase (adenine-specific)/adenine-specific DNA-methyltransferase